jgi:hypothetical protein
MKINISKTMGVMHLAVVFALVGAFFPLSISSSNATPAPCYFVEDGVDIGGGVIADDVLTNGSACTGDVIIDSGVTIIGQRSDGYGAFQGSGITSVTIPASVTEIRYAAFWETPSLSSVIFAPGSTLESISFVAFANTPSLQTITLPSSVNLIASTAFQTSGIQYIIFEGSPPNVNPYNELYFEGVSPNATAWVTLENFDAFDSQNPQILPYIRSLTAPDALPPPTIFSPSNGSTLTATVGTPFNETVSFFGAGNPTLEVSSGSLPPGITLNQSGALTGIPTTVAPLVTRTYPVSFTVVDGADSATVDISIEVLPPALPEITSETFTAYTGVPMNKSLNFFASGVGIITVSEGSLPPGVSVSAANRIVGTPTSSGTYTVKLTLTDSYSQSVTSDNFTFEIELTEAVNISASRAIMNPTDSSETALYSVITTNAPDNFIICGFYKDAADSESLYQKDECTEKAESYYVSPGITSNEGYQYFDNTTWVIRAYGPDARALADPNIETSFLVTVTVNVGQQNLYRNWQTPLTASPNGPKVGELVYASAFERELPRTLYKDLDGFRENEAAYPTPEEYVYRISKQPNSRASSVDHQSSADYESLTELQQDGWYTELGFGGENPPYQFTWKAFMCVNQAETAITKPTGLSLSYASREDGVLPDGSFNPAHNLMFKNAAIDWHASAHLQGIRTVVGKYWGNGDLTSSNFLGDSDPIFNTHVWGLLDVNGSCVAGSSLQALTILDSADEGAVAITTKSFAIPEQINLDYFGIKFQISSAGATLGVTGAGAARRDFNAALWGLTTIADSNTTPPPSSGGGGSSTPTPTPSATTSPRATQSANPIIQNRLAIPTQLKAGTTNNPEPLIKKLIEDISNSLKPIIVNIFTQQNSTPNPFFDSKRALEVASPSRDKKVVELPTLVRIDNELQSSKLVVIENTTVQVVTEGGGMLSVQAKDGVATIPVDNTGKVQMIRSNSVNTEGVGLLPNSEFAVYLFSEPTLLGVGKSDIRGNFYASFIVDKNLPLGNHTLQVNGILSNGKTSSISMPVTVVENADIAHSQATPKSNLGDENPVTKANNLSYLIMAIFVLLLIFMLFGGSRLFLVAGRTRQED